MLASILPGLREIRAPLAAGYLWLVTAWLLLHDRVDTGTDAPGAVEALQELRDAIGVGGVAAAATFVAYLLGALWEPLSAGVAEALWVVRRRVSSRRARLRMVKPHAAYLDVPEAVRLYVENRTLEEDVQEGLERFTPPWGIRLSKSAWRSLWVIGSRQFQDVDEALAVRLDSSAGHDSMNAFLRKLEPLLARAIAADRYFHPQASKVVTTEWQEATKALTEIEFEDRRSSWWVREAGDLVATRYPPGSYLRLYALRAAPVLVIEKSGISTSVEFITEAELALNLFEELPLVTRRLVGEQQESALDASRMKGEVDFRYALAVPLPITVSVAAFGLGFPLWAWTVATVAGLLAGWALLADGWRRDAARNDYLVELLSIGRAKSPTFERLLERARQPGPDGAGGPIDEAAVSAASVESLRS